MGHDQNPAVGLMISYGGFTIFFLLERAVDAVALGVVTYSGHQVKNGKWDNSISQ